MVVKVTKRQLWGYLGYKMLKDLEYYGNMGSIDAEYNLDRFQHSYLQIIAHLRCSIQ